ncbi:hypothetical protein B0H19DRAFT_1132337 [Mycena capillaripes]|nr:hypothetical protein B0H19DRAFT_1132337 [Mycena capillaripes]
MRSNAALRALYLLAIIVGVRAPDNRLLYTIPKNESIDTFRTCFEQTCTKGTWKPPPPKDLTFRGYIFEPGDFSGKNTDTEARIVCSWHNASEPNSTSVLFTTQVAKYLGATKT